MKGTLQKYIQDSIPVQSNLSLTMRDRGKIVARREGHNIFLNTGREWLSKLIAYSSYNPDVVETNERIRYMGLGIGGTRQLAPDFADTSPLSDYPPVGSFLQTDVDPDVIRLERPVRVSPAAWIGAVQAPVTHPTPTSTLFRRVFTSQEVSYAPYLSVPLSEVGLFLSTANTVSPSNVIIAYDTFDTLAKTTAFELEVSWTIRIG